MTQSSCISACLACVFHNTTLVFCIRHPPNLFSDGWTDLSVTLCAPLKCYLCSIASHWSAGTQPNHLSWLTSVSHSFFLIISAELVLWLECFSRWVAPAPEGQCVYLPALQQQLLLEELSSASRAFPPAAGSSTNSSVSHQSRCPGLRFILQPSSFTSDSSEFWCKTQEPKPSCPFASTGIHPASFLPWCQGQAHNIQENLKKNEEAVQREFYSRTEKQGTDARVHVIDMSKTEPIKKPHLHWKYFTFHINSVGQIWEMTLRKLTFIFFLWSLHKALSSQDIPLLSSARMRLHSLTDSLLYCQDRHKHLKASSCQDICYVIFWSNDHNNVSCMLVAALSLSLLSAEMSNCETAMSLFSWIQLFLWE